MDTWVKRRLPQVKAQGRGSLPLVPRVAPMFTRQEVSDLKHHKARTHVSHNQLLIVQRSPKQAATRAAEGSAGEFCQLHLQVFSLPSGHGPQRDSIQPLWLRSQQTEKSQQVLLN